MPLHFCPKKSHVQLCISSAHWFSLEAQLSACLLYRHHTLLCMCVWSCYFFTYGASPYKPLINLILVKGIEN